MGHGCSGLRAAILETCSALEPKAAYGEPAALKYAPPMGIAFDAGLPCFLGGTVQEPLGPMHFCCQDDRPKHVREETAPREKSRNILHLISACMKHESATDA